MSNYQKSRMKAEHEFAKRELLKFTTEMFEMMGEMRLYELIEDDRFRELINLMELHSNYMNRTSELAFAASAIQADWGDDE